MTDSFRWTGKEMRGGSLGACPGCSGQIAYGLDDKGQPDSILHSIPTRKDFDKRDPIEFASWVNAKRGNP